MERAAVWQALLESRDAAYQKFNEGLLPGKGGQTLGVRMPRLQQLAGEICRGDWRQFLEETETDTQYELVMLAGLVTGRCRCPWAEKHDRIAAFVPRIDCWGINDSFCAANREAGRRLADLEPLFRQCIASGQTYPIRGLLRADGRGLADGGGLYPPSGADAAVSGARCTAGDRAADGAAKVPGFPAGQPGGQGTAGRQSSALNHRTDWKKDCPSPRGWAAAV